MAEIAVRLLLQRLSSLIEEEGKLLGGLGRDVNEMKVELETIQSFLRDADSRGETNQRVKTWVKQVRDVAYDIEDLLDEFLGRIVRPCKHRIFDSLRNMLHDVKNLKTRHDLATKVQNIKRRLKAISVSRRTYSLSETGEGIARANISTPNTWHDPRIASLYMDEAEVVGIEVPKKILIGWLMEEELKLTIISVVGMGGLGKTTLVKKVYDSQMVNQHFDCRVWVTVSKSPMIEELLRTTIKKVLKETKQKAPEEMDTTDVNELIQVLRDQLSEKRYVIIFDDIWDINVWETMRFAFPNRESGSRIIFTTRRGEVAKYTNYSYSLEPLSDQEAWRLFCMKAFRSSSNNESIISCPKKLEELSRNILKKCSGLPLAIVLIGGLLAKKEEVWEWKNVHDSVGVEMRNDCGLESLNRILLLSYTSLPYYLKPCFMYLSMFPEDYFINRMKLIRLWIAEGFIEEKQGVTLEVVAGDYVNDLISRSMIQIADLNQFDEIKSCRIHDLMRETILLKSKEECFSTTIIIGSLEEGMGVAGLHETRRLSICHNNNTGDQKNSYPCSHIRSLMIFRLDESPPAQSFGKKFLCAFRVLRVLDLKGANLDEFPTGLVVLIHLRYLSLRSTNIAVLPKSVGKLRNLETLDLKYTQVSEFPVEIFKLQRLRYLLVCHHDTDLATYAVFKYGVSLPPGRIGNLTCLQKLTFLNVQQHQTSRDGGVVLKELQKLTQLRRLGVTNVRSKDGRDLCLALEKMKHLSSLEIFARSTEKIPLTQEEEEESLESHWLFNREDEFLELESLVSPPELLRHMHLTGRLRSLSSLNWIASLNNLISLVLQRSRLSCEEEENDPLKAFQHMPNLVSLQLLQAYNGEELCCSEVGGYKNLKKLFLRKMEGLKRMRFKKGSMSMLRELHIGDCPALEMVPHGIEHLSGLQYLRLFGRLHPGLVERIIKRPGSPPPPQPQEGQPMFMFRKRSISLLPSPPPPQPQETKPMFRTRSISLLPSQGEAQGGGEDCSKPMLRMRSQGEAQGGGEDCWRVQHIPKLTCRPKVVARIAGESNTSQN